MASTISAGTSAGTAIAIAGDTSGNLAFQTQAGANTITVPNATGTILTTGSPQSGGVIQVVQGNYTSSMTTTSTSFVDTGITATITPKFATSNILVIVNLSGGATSAVAYKLLRGSTGLSVSTLGSALNGSFGAFLSNANLVAASGFNYIDSPATTSATTYKIQIKATSGTVFWNLKSGNSTITLMEIAA